MSTMSKSNVSLHRPNEADDSVEKVISLSKAHQSLLGQLPFQVFRDAAKMDRLVVATAESAVVGYVLYRTRRRDRSVMLVHLCVADDARGMGVARSLIDELASHHPAASGIGAWCREDYEATSAWPHLGFDRVGTRAGKARSGTVLVHWWRPVSDRSLLICEPDPDGLPVAALDTNVFRDLKEPRLQHVESQALADGWLTDAVEFVLTSQVAAEIDEAATIVQSLRGTADSLRRLSPRPELWEPTKAAIDSQVNDPFVGEHDRRHIAQAAAAGAAFVVTRDDAMLASSEAIEMATGVVVVRPSQLLLRLHAGLEGESYQTAALYDTTWSIGSTADVPTRSELTAFLHPGERLAAFAMRVHSAMAGAGRGARLWTITREGVAIAMAAAMPVGDELTITIFRVSPSVHQRTLARQFLDRLRHHASASGFNRIMVEDTDAPYATRALRDEGFQYAEDQTWWAHCRPGFYGPGDCEPLSGRPVSSLSAAEVFELETQLWPARIVTGSTPTYVVPIRPGWALNLLGASKAAPTLLPRPDSLGAAREHVYYRSAISTLQTPARLLWYVSGKGAHGGFRAVSWLTQAVTSHPRTLYRRFGARGVYGEADVVATAKSNGLASALVFARTEVFERSIPLAEARTFYSPFETNGYLQSTRLVSEHVFDQLCQRGLP